MTRPKHPNKDIEKAIQYAEVYSKAGNSSHAWGRLLCSYQGREGCSLSIWSTPKVPEHHAKQMNPTTKFYHSFRASANRLVRTS